MAIEPSQEQLSEIVAAAEANGEAVVMLNLNRYHERARYEGAPPEGEEPDVTGKEAYERYAIVALTTLDRLGGRILWHAAAAETVVGAEGDVYDEVIAVWYPSRSAFIELATDAAITEALAHRSAGLEQAALICCESGPEPVLTGVELGSA
jgi:uncharacterized protein (DUF1330 family)